MDVEVPTVLEKNDENDALIKKWDECYITFPVPKLSELSELSELDPFAGPEDEQYYLNIEQENTPIVSDKQNSSLNDYNGSIMSSEPGSDDYYSSSHDGDSIMSDGSYSEDFEDYDPRGQVNGPRFLDDEEMRKITDEQVTKAREAAMNRRYGTVGGNAARDKGAKYIASVSLAVLTLAVSCLSR